MSDIGQGVERARRWFGSVTWLGTASLRERLAVVLACAAVIVLALVAGRACRVEAQVGEARLAEADSLDPCERERARVQFVSIGATTWAGGGIPQVPDAPSGFVVVSAEVVQSTAEMSDGESFTFRDWEMDWTTFERLDAALCHAQSIGERPYYVPRQVLLGVYELKRIPTVTKEIPSTREVVVAEPAP